MNERKRSLSHLLSPFTSHGYLLVVFSLMGCPLAWGQGTEQTDAAAVVSRYIRAVQQRDYKTIIDLTYSYQGDVAQIKAGNPQVLWPKLIAEYYEQRIATFSKEPTFWQSYGESLASMTGDPAQDIRAVRTLLPPSCKWKITESRSGVVDTLLFGRYQQTTVYVTVDYPSLPESPIIGKKFLKQTILGFSVDAKSKLVRGIVKLGQADVYWTKPYPAATVPFLRDKYGEELLAARNEKDAQAAIQELLDLGWDQAQPVLLEAVNKRFPFYTEAVRALADHRDPAAVPGVIAILSEKFKGKVKEPGCDQNTLLLISALQRIGTTDSAGLTALLKEALSNVLSADVSLFGEGYEGRLSRDNKACVNEYFLALASVDDPSWQSFPYWNPSGVRVPGEAYGPGSSFHKVLVELPHKDQLAGIIDRSSPNAPRILGYLNQFPCKPGWGGRCRVTFVADYVQITNPNRVRLFGEIWEYSDYFDKHRVVAAFMFELRRSNDPERPWLVENVTDRPTSAPSSGEAAVSEGHPSRDSVAPVCADYDSCLKASATAFQARRWDESLSYSEGASRLAPERGEAYVMMAGAYFERGDYNKFYEMADKGLSLGSVATAKICRDRFGVCEQGTLLLSRQEVALTNTRQQKVFSAPPSQVTSRPATLYSLASAAYSWLTVAGKNYRLYLIPEAVQCQIDLVPICPEPGFTQQKVFANYVHHAIQRLASGALLKPPVPPEPVQPPTAKDSQPLAGTGCASPSDLGYSILVGSRLYKVKSVASATGGKTYVFFDDKDLLVQEPDLLRRLALGTWTKENILASADVRNGSHRVSAILETSRSVQRYEAIQDVIARGMVEALAAGVTGGASLSKSIPNLTWGVLSAQLQGAPQTLFTLAAQRGLEESKERYKLLESELPPADGTAFVLRDLEKVKDLSTHAQVLELPNAALAVALMPKNWNELLNQALKSIASQVVSGLPKSNEVVTLDGLLKFQGSLAQLSKDYPALKAYSENLSLALRLAEANNRRIEAMAEAAASVCSQRD